MPAATNPRPANAHEARAAKARQLAAVAVSAAPTPDSLPIVLAGLRVASDDVWESLRIAARVNPPSRAADRHLGVSMETRAAVIALVECHVVLTAEMLSELRRAS